MRQLLVFAGQLFDILVKMFVLFCHPGAKLLCSYCKVNCLCLEKLTGNSAGNSLSPPSTHEYLNHRFKKLQPVL